MKTNDQLNLGIVGACARGGHFKATLAALRECRVHAVCDTNAGQLEDTAHQLGASESYHDYGDMLESSDIDAVLIGTPMPLHAPQAIAALQRDIHVFSEVTAGVSMEECRQLVAACMKSKALYMMGENYIYSRQNCLVTELVRAGLFGVPYYAEGEYIHELKGLNKITRWRRKWQTGVNGMTYGTHSLGPILQWLPSDRVVSVCCAGSGHHWKDLDGIEFEGEDTCIMLCRLAGGGLVKVRVDMISDRPHATTNYQLQGSDGCYESARSEGEIDRIWLRSRCEDINEWLDLRVLENEFLPEFWRDAPDVVQHTGHGGGDYFELLMFIEAVLGRIRNPIDVHTAMDMTLPGLCSQESIAKAGQWITVPDSRAW